MEISGVAFIGTGLAFIAGQRHFKLQKHFFKHKTVKTNDKIEHFEIIVMTVLSKRFWPEGLTYKGAKIMKILSHERSLIARKQNGGVIAVYPLLHDYVNTHVCILHNAHHTGQIEN